MDSNEDMMVSVLSEVKRNLEHHGVSKMVIYHTIETTAANLAGNDYEGVMAAVPMDSRYYRG